MRSVLSALAIDPGRTTGFAIAVVHDDKPFIAYEQHKLDHQQFYAYVDACASAAANQFNIICEEFDWRHNKTGVDLYPVELIGVLNYYLKLHYMNYIFYQKPSVQGKKTAYFSDKKLRELGLYQKEYEHGRSAVKHLLQWLQFGHGASQDADLTKAELVTIEWAMGNIV